MPVMPHMVVAAHLGIGVQGIFFTCAEGVTVADLVAGACAVLSVFAAKAGAARTETASTAAEMVFNMDSSSRKRSQGAGRMAGLVDLGVTLRGGR